MWRIYNREAGRLWKYIENNLLVSKTYLQKFKDGKIPFPPVPYRIGFKDWNKEE